MWFANATSKDASGYGRSSARCCASSALRPARSRLARASASMPADGALNVSCRHRPGVHRPEVAGPATHLQDGSVLGSLDLTEQPGVERLLLGRVALVKGDPVLEPVGGRVLDGHDQQMLSAARERT